MQAPNASATSSLILFLPSSCLAMMLAWTSAAQRRVGTHTRRRVILTTHGIGYTTSDEPSRAGLNRVGRNA
jgi:hypothetical protein